MDVAQKREAASRAVLDRACMVVLAQHGLAAETKLAWLQLWHATGGRPGTLTQLHPAALGEKQGALDPLRSGKHNIEALAQWGLVQILDRYRANWTVYVEDPMSAVQERLRRVAGDGQGELFREEQTEEPKSPPRDTLHIRPPPEPASVVQLTPVLPAANAHLPPISRSLRGRSGEEEYSRSEVEVSARSDLGTGGKCAIDAGLAKLRQREQTGAADPPTIGDELPRAFDRFAAAVDRKRDGLPEEAAKLVAWILGEVNDPNLLASVAENIAWAVIEDKYPRGKLARILTRLRVTHGKRSAHERGAYFNGAMRRSFAEAGLELFKQKRSWNAVLTRWLNIDGATRDKLLRAVCERSPEVRQRQEIAERKGEDSAYAICEALKLLDKVAPPTPPAGGEEVPT